MAHEWKVGDRFTLEFEVTGWSGEWLECKTMSSARRAFPPSDMQYAKLIKPAAPEPQKLDTSKPMRLLGSDEASFTFLQRATNGMLIIKWDSGSLDVLAENEVENIPAPKIKGRREVVLLRNGVLAWDDPHGYSPGQVVGRAWVEITEGDGMEEQS